MSQPRVARSDAEILRCFPVMRQLRTHLVESEFVARIRLQMEGGYRLALLEAEGAVVSVAGYRLLECLSAGRVLYVDDLVTDEARRSHGHGAAMLHWLADQARAEGCAKLDLDSGVQRKDAHRFYLAHDMPIFAYHFRMEL